MNESELEQRLRDRLSVALAPFYRRKIVDSDSIIEEITEVVDKELALFQDELAEKYRRALRVEFDQDHSRFTILFARPLLEEKF